MTGEQKTCSFRERMLELVQEFEEAQSARAAMEAELSSLRRRVSATSTMSAPVVEEERSSPPSGFDSELVADFRLPSPPPTANTSDVDFYLAGCRLDDSEAQELEKHLIRIASDPEDQRLDRFVVLPTDFFRVAWDVILMVGLVYELWLVGLELGFLVEGAVPGVFGSVSHGITVYLFIDIAVNFHTVIYHRDQVIRTRQEIRSRYLRGWFWPDLLSTIPWYFLLSSFSGRLVRLIRFTKVVKLLKALHLVRLIRTATLMSKLGTLHHILRMRYLSVPVQAVVFLVLAAHAHGCIRAGLIGWELTDDFGKALDRYYRSVGHVYLAFIVGSTDSQPDVVVPNGLLTLEIVIATERLFFLAFVGMWGLYVAQCRFQDDVKLMQLKENVLRYLQRHNIGIATRVQMLFMLQDTWNANRLQRDFHQMMDHNLPTGMHEKVLNELWSDQLCSLGLIAALVPVYSKFATELSAVVAEEVLPSLVLLFRHGDRSDAAYRVLEGSLGVVVALERQEPDYRDGDWIGEMALVNPGLRRNRTVVTRATTCLMIVPAEGFQELLKRLKLEGSFRQLCTDHLARGLCGRCGILGDHFAHDCPKIGGGGEDQTRMPSFPLVDWAPRASKGRRNPDGLQGELVAFLTKSGLAKLQDALFSLRCLDLVTLEQLDAAVIRSALQPGEELTDEEAEKLSPEAIQQFRELRAATVQRVVLEPFAAESHFVFLSHSKMEAGTEAALMRAELEQMVSEEMSRVRFNIPIFLDADDLTSLEGVQKAVRKSHNLAVLLTNQVLSRPWVLIEIVTAFASNAQLLPVKVTKPGNTFVFPDEGFYRRLHEGEFLTVDGYLLLRKVNINLLQVEEALKALFTQIAVEYSPHRSGEIRQLELRSLLRRCTFRTDLKSTTGSDPEPRRPSPASAASARRSPRSASALRLLEESSDAPSAIPGTPHRGLLERASSTPRLQEYDSEAPNLSLVLPRRGVAERESL